MAKLRSSAGFTLAEAVMAAGLMATLFVGIISIFNFALKSNQHNAMNFEIENARRQIRTRIDCAQTKAKMGGAGCYYPVLDSAQNVIVGTYNPANEVGTATRFGVSILVRGNKCAADAATNPVPIDYKLVEANTDTPKIDQLTKRTSGNAQTNFWAPLFDSAPLCGSTSSVPGNSDLFQMCPKYTSMVGYYVTTGQPACLVINGLHSRRQIGGTGSGNVNHDWISTGLAPLPFAAATPIGCIVSNFNFNHGHNFSLSGQTSGVQSICSCVVSGNSVLATGFGNGTLSCGGDAFYW